MTPLRSLSFWILLASFAHGAEPALRDLASVPEDLAVPEVTDGLPAAGKRVRLSAPGYEGTTAHHTVYLPTDWQAGKKFPVLFEYAGNGNYSNPKLGDTCDGSVEGSHLGFGLS